jgi:hypothetical protein
MNPRPKIMMMVVVVMMKMIMLGNECERLAV